MIKRKNQPSGWFRLLTNPDDAILNGEDRQKSKASAPRMSAPRMARLEPTWMYLRRLYDLPVLSVAGTLSTTSNQPSGWFFYGCDLYLPTILPARSMHQILL
ncbi:acetyltransferase [Yersinia pseudotuberculosis]|nr:acetyltransferase [Yersinia pseudotuberculosis]